MAEELEKILGDFGTKLVEDVRESWMTEKRKKAAKYGRSANENSRLNASMEYEVTYKGDTLQMVFKMADTYVFPESGRNPGGVSKQGQLSLAEWIKRNGMTPQISAKAKKTVKSLKNKTVKKAVKQQSLESKIKGMVYVISRKIKQRGFDGTGFYNKVISDGRVKELQTLINEQFKKDIEIIFKTN